MEYVLRDGFVIGVEREEKPNETIIHVRGPHKNWDFHVKEENCDVWDFVQNIPRTEKRREGETTALATVGMDQLQSEASRKRRPIRYVFRSDALSQWYVQKGERVIQPNAGSGVAHGRALGIRIFIPQILPSTAS